MALEWPDYEAEMKKKEKMRKSRNGEDGFIVHDDEDVGKSKGKKKTKQRLCFLLLVYEKGD